MTKSAVRKSDEAHDWRSARARVARMEERGRRRSKRLSVTRSSAVVLEGTLSGRLRPKMFVARANAMIVVRVSSSRTASSSVSL